MGGSRARNGAEYFADVSEDSGFSLGSFDGKGFGVREVGGNGKR